MIRTVDGRDPWQCEFSNGATTSVADTPKHGGAGTGFRPHELLAAALATCQNVTVRMQADRMNLDPTGVETVATLDRSGSETTVEYAVTVEGLDSADAESVRRAAEGCPVQQTLTGPLDVVRRPDLG